MTEREQIITMDGKEEGADQSLSKAARDSNHAVSDEAVLAASAKLLRRNRQAYEALAR